MSLYKYNEFIKKFIYKKQKKNLKRKKIKHFKKLKILNSKKIIMTKKTIPPKIFSISQNSLEVLKFFKKIQNHCEECEKKILLDMREIEKIDIDALMYLKYIVYVIKEKQRKKIILSFISPKDKALKKFIRSSGFITYNNKKSKFLDQSKKRFSTLEHGNNILEIESNQNFKIKRGDTIDTQVSKSIVDFTFNGKVPFLYNMMSELMENTIMHAYTDKSDIEHKDWYIFAEKNDEKISFVFLDTGLGIPNTVQKRLTENVNPWTSSSKILLSTLEGDKRTRTKAPNRGKGLPFIYGLYNDEKIKNLRIISNKACFNLNNGIDNKEELSGTLFYWEIKGED